MVLDRGQLEAREADGEQRSGLSRSHHRSISILDVGGIQSGFRTWRNGGGVGVEVEEVGKKERQKGRMEREEGRKERGRE